jgi:hypothetical protein
MHPKDRWRALRFVDDICAFVLHFLFGIIIIIIITCALRVCAVLKLFYYYCVCVCYYLRVRGSTRACARIIHAHYFTVF